MVFLSGFVDAIAGGGGFFSLTAYLLAGLPVHNAIATNKLSATIGTSLAAYRYARKGFIPWKLAVVCIPAALLGSMAGARLALAVTDTIFRWIMLGIIPVSGYYVLRKKDLDGGSPLEDLPYGRTALLTAIIALGIGVYDGFYGPGTGTFLLLLLTGLAKLDLNTSVGTGKVTNWATNLAALGVFIFSGNVLYVLGLVASVFSLLGNYLGTVSFYKKGSRLARPMILVVLVVFFCKLLWEQLG
jgi:hypothetical protein